MINMECNELSGSLPPGLPWATLVPTALESCSVGGPDYAGTCASDNYGPYTTGNKWVCGEYNKGTSFAFANTKAGCWGSCSPAPSP